MYAYNEKKNKKHNVIMNYTVYCKYNFFITVNFMPPPPPPPPPSGPPPPMEFSE